MLNYVRFVTIYYFVIPNILFKLINMTYNKLYKIVYNEKFGRHMIALRDILPGEIIFDEPPLVKGPGISSKTNSINKTNNKEFNNCSSASEIEEVCLSCNKVLKLNYFCEKCKLKLCSKECLIENDLHYQNECKIFQKIPIELIKSKITHHQNEQLTFYNFITIIRCLFIRVEDPNCKGKWRQFQELESKYKEFSLSGGFDHIEPLMELLSWDHFMPKIESNKFYKLEGDEDIKIVGKICLGAMRNNAFSFIRKNYSLEGLYFLSSFMSHNCSMNTDRQLDINSGHMVVKAGIKILKSQPITTTYLDCLNNTLERNIELLTNWQFTCSCERCSDNSEFQTFLGSLRCPFCKQFNLTFKLSQEELEKRIFLKKSSQNHIKNQDYNIFTEEAVEANKGFEKLECNCSNEFCQLNSSRRAIKADDEIEKLFSKLKQIAESRPNDFYQINLLESWLEDSEHKDNKNEIILNKNHSLITQAKYFLSHFYGRGEDDISKISNKRLQNKIDYCYQIIKIYESIFSKGGIYQFMGKLHCELWIGLREKYYRENDNKPEEESNAADLKEIQEEALIAYKILSHGLKNSEEEVMSKILFEELQ